MVIDAPGTSQKSGRDVEQLAKRLKLEPTELRKWLMTPPTPDGFGYRSFLIPKRSGKKRLIDAPNDELKSLQERIYRKLLRGVPIQNEANGFVPRRSILDNVKPHLDSQIIIKIDLKNFFHSIDQGMVVKYWAADGWNEECSAILTNICCKDGSLPQGSPTSPALSNLVNRGFDAVLWEIARRYSARYTRYADDITMSFPAHHIKAHAKVKSILNEIRSEIENEGYQVQWSKGIKILRPHQRQIITGLLVNKEIRLPRATRHRIRALRYLSARGELSEKDIKRLEGYELLNKMVVDYVANEGPKLKSIKENTETIPSLNSESSNVLNIESNSLPDSASGNEGKPWTRSDKIAFAGVVIAVLALLVAAVFGFIVPEVRSWLGLPK